MVEIKFDHQTFRLNQGESVLDCLERHEVKIPSSCRQGVCQTCVMRANNPPAESQIGLKNTSRKNGYFLACRCHPTEDMEIFKAAEFHRQLKATVLSVDHVSEQICRLRVVPESEFPYRAGQFLNIINPENISRTFSLASVPDHEPFLEMHIRIQARGRVSSWIHSKLKPGDNITITDPLGQCYYLPDNPNQPLLLIGTGAGLAPLYGILRDALYQNHKGPIHLYHGSRHPNGIYLQQELKELEKSHANFYYQPCVSGEDFDGFIHARASDYALEKINNLQNWRVFLCGNPNMVMKVKKMVFLAGVGFDDIHADAFSHAAS